MLWCVGIVLLIPGHAEAPAVLTSFGGEGDDARRNCKGMVSGDGHCPCSDACGGREFEGAKTMSFVQINSQLKKEQVEEEPALDSIDDDTPRLDVEVTSPALTEVAPPRGKSSSRSSVALPGKDSSSRGVVAPPHEDMKRKGLAVLPGKTSSSRAFVAPPGEESSRRTLVAPPGEDLSSVVSVVPHGETSSSKASVALPGKGSNSKFSMVPPDKDSHSRASVVSPGKDWNNKPSDSASLHLETVSQGQRSYQGQEPSMGAKFVLRLRQLRELAGRVGRQRTGAVSAAVVASLVGVGVIILCLTLVAGSRWQSPNVNNLVGTRRIARGEYPGPPPSRGDRSQRGSVPKLPTAGLLPNRDSMPQPAVPQLVSTEVAGVSRMSTTGHGREGLDDLPDPDAFFCPDLVVPPGCECILKVPTAALSRGPFDVTDVNDNAVLHIEPRVINVRPSIVPGGTEQRQAHRLVLTTEYGTIMAQCGPSAAPRECVLLRAAGDHYAKITGTEEKAYTMLTRTGLKLFFWGSFEDHAMNVIDSSGRLIAKTGSIADLPASGETVNMAAPESSQGSPIYRLRVAPLMDVGLVLCGLLCIQHLM